MLFFYTGSWRTVPEVPLRACGSAWPVEARGGMSGYLDSSVDSSANEPCVWMLSLGG